MLEPSSSGALIFPHARMRAAEALLRARRAQILAAVVRQAEAGDRTAVRLARAHGLPVEPPPDVLAARLAASVERTRATVATLLVEGGLDVGPAHPAGAQVIAFSDVKRRRRTSTLCRGAAETAGALVNNNENTSAAADGDASFDRK